MHEKTFQITLGGLLHDIGKIGDRAGRKCKKTNPLFQDSSIKEYTKNTEAIVEIGSRIAMGSDACLIEEAEKKQMFGNSESPLYSIFNIMHGKKLDYSYPYKKSDQQICYPTKSSQNVITEKDYQRIFENFYDEFKDIPLNETELVVLLAALEKHFSFVPYSIVNKEIANVSLFDHAKMTAAISACINEYLLEQGKEESEKEFSKNGASFLDKKAFLMFSSDFSGIQGFIYNITSDGAKKSLRSRSFFLEMIIEHLIDEILCGCQLSRTNLIYSGGGHCYLLLPNTETVKQYVDNFIKRVNLWLRETFGTELYLSSGYQECSGNDLMNIPQKESPYRKLYEKLNHKISVKKHHRYSGEDIRFFNQSTEKLHERECSICGRSDYLVSVKNENSETEEKCTWCYLFEDISNALINEDLMIAVSENGIQDNEPEMKLNVYLGGKTGDTSNKNVKKIKFPTIKGEVLWELTDSQTVEEAIRRGKSVIRTYSKGQVHCNMKFCGKIYMGDYSFGKLNEQLAENAEGIKRWAICRADVDNLGMAFTSGFEQKSEDAEEKNRYVTFARTASFSRQMSLFFKEYMNEILKGNGLVKPFSLYSTREEKNIQNTSEDSKKKQAVIVYSGGDDVFLIGAWDDIVEAIIDIRTSFHQYTAETLTISCGITLHKTKYPIKRAAYESAELEETAKHLEGKNGISLFTTMEDHSYHWEEFIEKVAIEKLAQLQSFFYCEEEQERGNTFLHRLLEFLKVSERRINLARYAYLLARMEPNKESKSYKAYAQFSKNMYLWIQQDKDRKELITAIYLYLYLTRVRGE